MAQTQKLQIVIDAQNKADAAIGQVNSRLEGLSTTVDSLQPAFKKMAAVGGIAFAGLSAIAISSFKASADAAAQMANATNIVRNSLESLSDDGYDKLVKQAGKLEHPFDMVTRKMKEAGKAAVQLAFDDEAASTAFARLFQITGDTAKAQDELNLAMNLARYSGQSLESSVDALIKVHAGGTRVLKEFGIEVKEGTTAQEAFAIVAERTAGSAQTFADSAAGGMERIKVQMDNLQETIGDALAPAFQKIIDLVGPLITKFVEWAEANPQLVATILGVGIALAGIVTAVGVLGIALPAVISGFSMLAVAVGALSFPFIIVTAAIVAIVALVVWWVKNWSENVESMKELWNGFKDSFIGTWEAIKDFFSGVWEEIKNIFGAAIDWMLAKIQPILNAINSVKSGFSSVVGGISSGVKAAASFITGRASGGPVTAGRPYIVGEHGPELFTPNAYGRISSSGDSGASIILNITGNSFLGKEGVAREIGQEIMNQLKLYGRIA